MDFSSSNSETLDLQLKELLANLAIHPHRELIQRSLAVLLRIAESDTERLNWKIITASLEDLEQGFKKFYPYRHTRKISIFGSARTSPQQAEYKLAVDFARCMTESGFMVITGAGGGIMQAGNEGAAEITLLVLISACPLNKGQILLSMGTTS